MRILLLNVIFFLLISFGFSQTTDFPEMIFVEGGSFKMGSTTGYDDEKPVHSVTLTNYYIGKYEVTVAQYRKYCTATGKTFPAVPDAIWYEENENATEWEWKDKNPIVNVTYSEAVAYCEWLSKQTGEEYTLPTEAQWEYAARGGKNSKGYNYSGSNNINEVAWYDETTYERGPRQVGLLKANELGIYDMSGNAWEWCLDYYGAYSSSSQKNPTGASSGTFRVIRGGSWYYTEDMARNTVRDGPKPFYTNYNYGFRVAKIIK